MAANNVFEYRQVCGNRIYTSRRDAERAVACGYGVNAANRFSPTAEKDERVRDDDNYSVDLNSPSYDALEDVLSSAFERDGKFFLTLPDSFRK